ncbi:MAG: hypothetical protein ACR2GZ_04375 [Solirubrobacteraceae bacterium]
MLELTVNVGRQQPYDLGEGYNHMPLVIADPDGYRIELIDGAFPPLRTPAWTADRAS